MKYDLSKRHELKRADLHLTRLSQGQKVVEIKEVQPPKTNQQNRYIRVCYKILSDETGYTPEEIATLMKRNSGFMTYEKGSHTFYKSVADLDLEQTGKYIDFIRTFAEDNGFYIMSPEEFFNHWREVEK